MPGLGDQSLQLELHLVALDWKQVAVVEGGQLRGHGVVFLDQGAPRHFGGVRGEHQLDIQAAQLARQLLGLVPIRHQALQQLGQHPVIEGLRLVRPTPADAVILLGNIGQVEELIEGPRHRQQLVIAERGQRLAQLSVTGGRALAPGLGPLADLFDLGQEGLAALVANTVAEQLAEQVNLFAQTRIDFRHDRPLRLGIEPSACTERLVLTSTRRMAMPPVRAS